MGDCFDLAVYGEGEFTLLEVIQNMQKYGRDNLAQCLAGVGNVIYRDETGTADHQPGPSVHSGP